MASAWLNRVVQLLYTTDFTQHLLACKLIRNGPPPGLVAFDDEFDAPGGILDITATYHIYGGAIERLQHIALKTEDSELSVLAKDCVAVLERKRSMGHEGPKCCCQGCSKTVRMDNCKICATCKAAYFCSSKCKQDAKLGIHASCYLGRVYASEPYKLDSILYLIVLIGYGKYWPHRVRALWLLSHHVGGPSPSEGNMSLEPYNVNPAEARMICRSGLTASLARFLVQIRQLFQQRRENLLPIWPDEWLDPEDPGAMEWGLGALALRTLRLVEVLFTPRPPGLASLEWSESEITERSKVFVRAAMADPACCHFKGRSIRSIPLECEAMRMTLSGGVALGGLVELCINAAPSFPRRARHAARWALLLLDRFLTLNAIDPSLNPAVTFAASYMSPSGLRELLHSIETPTAAIAGEMSDGGGGGGGGGTGVGAHARVSREVFLSCLIKFLSFILPDRSIRRMVRDEWYGILDLLKEICESAAASAVEAAAAASSGRGGGGDSSSTSRRRDRGTGSAASDVGGGGGGLCRVSISPAAALVEEVGQSLKLLIRHRVLKKQQVRASVRLLISMTGAEVCAKHPAQGGPGGEIRAQEASIGKSADGGSGGGGGGGGGSGSGDVGNNASRAQEQRPTGALRTAALEALSRLAEQLSYKMVSLLLPYTVRDGAPPPPPPTPSSTSSSSLPVISSAATAAATAAGAPKWTPTSSLLPSGLRLLNTWDLRVREAGAASDAPKFEDSEDEDEDEGEDEDEDEDSEDSEDSEDEKMEEQEDENTVGYKYGWIQMAKLWDSVRDPLWGSVRQLEGMFGFSSRGWIPGVIGLSGDTEVELVVDAARRMGHALKETGRSAEFASIVAASGALPSLARCLWLIQSSMVAGALEVLRMTCWPLHRELPSQEPRGALTQPNTPPDYGGCISPGSRAVVEVLLKPQHFVVRPSGGPFAASSSSRGTGASTSQPRADEIESNRVFDSVLERPLDRLIRLATDPGVVMRSVDYLDQHFTAQQVQSDALRTIATLLATTDAGTSLSLLADPKLVHVIMSLHEHPLAHPHPHPHTSFNGTPSSYTSAEMPYSATPLRYSIMGVIAGLIAAVPRWEQAVEEGHGVFGSGGESVARCDSAGDTKKRDKKKGGGGGGGGGTASAVQSEQYTPAKSLSVAAGLRAAADVLSYMECLANELQHPQEQLFVRSMDNYLYDLLEAVQPGENVLRVVGTRELKVGYTTRIMNMLEKLGGGAAAAAAAVAAVSATAAGGGGTSPVLPARTGHRAVAEDGACGIDVGTDRCGSDVNAAAAVPAATTSTAAASGSGTFAVSAAKQCANCGVREGDPGVGKLRKCGGCLVARYCSSGCQAAAWPQHKRECKGMAGGSRGGARDSAVRAIRQISS